MILLIGPYGGVDFKRTSLFFRANIEDLLRCLLHNSMEIVDFDFGAGSETSFRCCKCNRFIPLITGSVDHVIPRTRLLSNIQFISRRGEVYDSVQYGMGNVSVCTSGEIYVIRASNSNIETCDYQLVEKRFGGVFMQVAGKEISLRRALENDMQNLQLMCHYCNSRKGNLFF